MRVQFSKYHGLANDFVLIPDPDGSIGQALSPKIIRDLCARNEGIGADGILLRQNSAHADHRMVLYNADGSMAEISGNGLRCFALFLKEQGYDTAGEFSVETGGGVQRVWILDSDTVETTMPLPDFATQGVIPQPVELCVEDKCFPVVPVNVGNPHGVIFGPERDEGFVARYGAALEKHEHFPAGANIEFVTVLSPQSCKLVVWERGAGLTRACGSGSVATACAGTALHHFVYDAPIHVHQPGGTLLITVRHGFSEIRQRGPATFVYRGEMEIALP